MQHPERVRKEVEELLTLAAEAIGLDEDAESGFGRDSSIRLEVAMNYDRVSIRNPRRKDNFATAFEEFEFQVSRRSFL